MSLPLPFRFWQASASVGHKIVIHGGWDGKNRCFGDIWIFDTDRFSWMQPRTGGLPPAPRQGLSGAPRYFEYCPVPFHSIAMLWWRFMQYARVTAHPKICLSQHMRIVLSGTVTGSRMDNMLSVPPLGHFCAQRPAFARNALLNRRVVG